ncbi:hypothetical protein LPJ60_005639 [Coemansia sp. RSA 2675]|nr:hypothetical protein LPJ60_005639 [Coemansia sp. RSA 2675]
MTSQDLSKERRIEMLEHYSDRLIVGDSIRKLTRPVDARLRRMAEAITESVSGDMEKALELPSKGAGSSGDKENSSIASRTRSRGGRTTSTLALGPATKHAPSNGNVLSQGVAKLDISPKESEQLRINEIRKWAKTEDKFGGSEKDMYESIIAFFAYVARGVKRHLTTSKRVSEDTKGKCRLIIPGLHPDYKPGDSDDSTRIDIGLTDSRYNAAIESCTNPSYYQMRAIIEAKRGKTSKDLRDAFVQLSEYTRQMFAEQYDLRFAFGFTICAGEVCLYHFGNSKIVASAPMDIATREGRCSFIELIVNMSLCENSRLGRDPTMQFLSDLNCWEIDCPDDDDDNCAGRDTVKQYYFSDLICVADRLLGRHTRCFPATDIRPTKKREKGEPLKATVVIKDAFAFAKPDASEDGRDEARTLKRIRSEFESKNPDDIMYPKIVVGGRVRFKRGDKTIEDTTSTMYEDIDDGLLEKVSGGTLFRAHRRIVLASIGEPLRTVETVKEFVTVICDAMESHHAIVERCQILHRDISDNNILVVRSGDTVRGLLIDFDCAIDTSKDRGDVRHEMTGTLPYMSFNNITYSNVKRTSLDDCESMLYLLCWYATIGFGSKDERDEAKVAFKKKAIAQWRNGGMDSIAEAKRLHIASPINFVDCIVKKFDTAAKHSMELRGLALRLYQALFESRHFDTKFHGSRMTGGGSLMAELLGIQPQPTATSGDGFDESNPFAMRSREWEVISRDFLDVLARAKEDMVNWVDAPQQPR